MQAPRFVFASLVFAVLAFAGAVSAQGANPAPVPPTVPPITISL